MLVSHDKRFIFLKTEKTAGTSVEMAYERYCAPSDHEVTHSQRELVTPQGVVGARGRQKGASAPIHERVARGDITWYNHMPAAKICDLLGPQKWSDYVKFTTVRNPFDKAVSWFWWQHRGQEITAPVDEFRAFILNLKKMRYFGSDRDRDWRTCHIGRAMVVDHVVRVEHLREDMARLDKVLGTDTGDLALATTKTRTRAADQIAVPDYYDRKTANILRDAFGWMFDLGGYSTDPQQAVNAGASAARTLTAAR